MFCASWLRPAARTAAWLFAGLGLLLVSASGADLPGQAISSHPIPGTYSAKPSSLQGQVRDAQGRPVAGASVTLAHAGEQAAQTATTNGEGIFRIRNLLPGTYDLVVEKPGFQTQTTHGKGRILLKRQANCQHTPASGSDSF